MKKRDKVNLQSLDTQTPVPQSGKRSRGQVLEWTLLAIVVFVGSSLRLAFPQLTTVEHFDEGVYASNLLFDKRFDYQYPMRHLYAPPLLPALIEGCMVLGGRVSGLAAILPSWFAGCATIAIVWWLARSWLGPAAAIAAASLAAFSDVHAMFTRTALTDVCLLFFCLLALAAFGRAQRTLRMLDWIAAGSVVGLAWWTKYNGWLPLFVAFIAIVASGVVDRQQRRLLGRRLAGWTGAALTAAIVWSPFLYALQSRGGYSQIAANHSRYIVGPSGWIASLLHQIANLNYIGSAWGSSGWGVALLSAWLVDRYLNQQNQSRRIIRWSSLMAVALSGGLFVALAAVLGGGTMMLVMAMISIVVCLFQWITTASRPTTTDSLASMSHYKRPKPETCVAAATNELSLPICWFGLLFVMTPLYTPYLRLILPLVSAAWLVSAGGITFALRKVESLIVGESKRSLAGVVAIWLVCAVSVFALSLTFGFHVGVHPPWLDDRRGLEHIAAEIGEAARQSELSQAQTEGLRVIYVFGEPALLFQLRSAGQPVVLPVDMLQLQPVNQQGREVPTYLAFGLHAMRDTSFQREFERESNRFELVRSFTYRPSVTVLLDQFDPRNITDEMWQTEVKLYRIRARP